MGSRPHLRASGVVQGQWPGKVQGKSPKKLLGSSSFRYVRKSFEPSIASMFCPWHSQWVCIPEACKRVSIRVGNPRDQELQALTVTRKFQVSLNFFLRVPNYKVLQYLEMVHGVKLWYHSSKWPLHDHDLKVSECPLSGGYYQSYITSINTQNYPYIPVI